MLFLSKIRYKIQNPDTGKWKTIVEQFLHEAEQYNEVENIQLPELLGSRVTDYEYDIVKAHFEDIYAPFTTGDFYEVTLITDEGDGKKTTSKHLVVAESLTDAERRTEDYTKSWGGTITIDGAKHSKILGYWHPHNQQWQDDFVQRTLNLQEQLKSENGPAEKVPNQMSLFDEVEEGLEKLQEKVDQRKEYLRASGYDVATVKPIGNDDDEKGYYEDYFPGN